jgi:hypothetical protein
VNVAPWTPRRHSTLIAPASPLAARPRSNTTPNVLRTLPENVLRLPRGPDGTRGFRNRLAAVSAAARVRSVSAPMCPSALAFTMQPSY